MTTLDVREIPPAERHPKIHQTFEALAPGETLTIVNDHEPKPLYYEMAAEVSEFDENGYRVERESSGKFVAEFPKRESGSTVSRTRLEDLEGEPHANAFPDETPTTIRVRLSEGERVPEHDHPDNEIVFHLLEGELDLQLGDDTHRVEAGELLRFDGDQPIEPIARADSTAVVVLAPRSNEA